MRGRKIGGSAEGMSGRCGGRGGGKCMEERASVRGSAVGNENFIRRPQHIIAKWEYTRT
jgi:hypothetical protein